MIAGHLLSGRGDEAFPRVKCNYVSGIAQISDGFCQDTDSAADFHPVDTARHGE